jgi:hypothetical protein
MTLVEEEYTPSRTAQGDLETSWGTLYRPLSDGRQILVMLGVFFGGPAIGWTIGHLPADLSESARTVLCIPFALVFFAGYALWVARLQTIAWEGLGRSVFRALFSILIKRQKPKSLEEVLPTKQQLVEMAVRAQRAGASFWPVSWPIAVLAGASTLSFDTAANRSLLFMLVFGSVLSWGYTLARLGRRGCLPFMESE